MEEKNFQINKSEAASREERVLEFWKQNKIFEKSLNQTEGGKEFVFYEGPPTANGEPGIHHLEARAFKDAVPRYKTMRGYHVRRKGGWDTHGLPVELQVEKKLGLNSKKAIEEYGIAKFNQECKESVWEYLDVWNRFTRRIGYWVDQDNPYVTYHNEYIESVWHIVKKVNERGLLYKDYKVVPWCPRCGTVLSSHELAQGYEDVKDLSVYAKFKIKGQDRTYILAWTTTPWTLPGNVALAVGEYIPYVKIEKDSEFLILAKDRLNIIDGGFKIVSQMKGKDLIGSEYEPLYPYLAENIAEVEKPKLAKAYKVYGADFVNTEDGTGIVHTAVMYGQDDFVLGTQTGLPKHHLVGLDGKFLAGTGIFEGRFVKDEEVAVDIIKDLAHRGLLFKKEKYEHSYPHCWRCKTALIYYARDSWYIRMSDPKIKKELIQENGKINWEPGYIKNGRFGEWLREIKDWAISRERYWGTPLPVWVCEACKKVELIGSIADLKNKSKKSGNKYFVMRHGESEGNLEERIKCNVEDEDHLTEKGRQEVLDAIPELKNKKIDLIISSDFIRTRETAEIVKKELGISDSSLIFDAKIREFNVGTFDGKTWEEYYESREKKDWYSYIPKSGESCKDVKQRMTEFLYGIENKYKSKNILLVMHEGPARMLCAGIKGWNDVETSEKLENEIPHFKNAKVVELPFVPIPHNQYFELDLHRPYIDEISLVCDCGGSLVRTKEVMDVWLDSGAMPFAEDHYPFENKKWVEGVGYPADYISEAIDQTRGWFYTLHAVGVLMGRGRAYKNVICLGHLMDASGKKMSKSLGNIVDPFVMIEKYGVDALRLWMYSVNQPGESKNFDEKTVALLQAQVFGLLYNVLAFYELYPMIELGTGRKKSNQVLDQWILARLDELTESMTHNLERYKLLEPVRELKEFVNDLSTWYLRRSRERIKEGDEDAKQTLYFVLKTLAMLMAPFAPFAAEDIWLRLKTTSDPASVHLAKWPSPPRKFFTFGRPNVLSKMETVRNIVSLGLEARQRAGIKVRQPLGKLELVGEPLSSEYIQIIKDELNIKNIHYALKMKIGITKVELDTSITSELKEEGNYRELLRGLQDIRKSKGLTPSDAVNLVFETNEEGKRLVQKFESDIKKAVLATQIEFQANGGQEIKIDSLVFNVKIDKI